MDLVCAWHCHGPGETDGRGVCPLSGLRGVFADPAARRAERQYPRRGRAAGTGSCRTAGGCRRAVGPQRCCPDICGRRRGGYLESAATRAHPPVSKRLSHPSPATARRPPAPSAREVAALVLSRVESERAFANVLLHHQLTETHLPPVDAGLAMELVYGTLRHQARLDWTIAGALRYALDELPPRIRAILRTAVYQLLFLERIPARAIVHEAVHLARRHGHAGTAALVNAVLRRIADRGERPLPAENDPVTRIAVEHSHPGWLVDRWVRRSGIEDTIALCRANNTPAPIYARVNRLRASPDAVIADLAASGVTARPTPLAEGLRLQGPFEARHRLVESGVLTVQDLGAMVVTHLLDPQPGETIIDACAAPGGKTTHIAERMADQGRVIASDIHPGKAQAMHRRLTHLGLQSVEVLVQDARGLGEMLPQVADRVLVDAPCTGLGVLRRRPEIKWRARAGHLPTGGAPQRAGLEGAARAAPAGGSVPFRAWPPERAEHRRVLGQFLEHHRDYELDPTLRLPEGLPVLPADRPGMVTLLPHRHGTDGFFIVRMRRRN